MGPMLHAEDRLVDYVLSRLLSDEAGRLLYSHHAIIPRVASTSLTACLGEGNSHPTTMDQ